jgi:hypothetical protein
MVKIAAVIRRMSSGGRLPRGDRSLDTLDHRIHAVLTTDARGAGRVAGRDGFGVGLSRRAGRRYENLRRTTFTVGLADADHEAAA